MCKPHMLLLEILGLFGVAFVPFAACMVRSGLVWPGFAEVLPHFLQAVFYTAASNDLLWKCLMCTELPST